MSESEIQGLGVVFGQKGYHFHGEWCPPPLGAFLSPQTPFALTLRAFGATRMVSHHCHKWYPPGRESGTLGDRY
jgi:hypothetical protein